MPPTAPPLDPTIVAELKQEGLLHEGHFAYRSGCHGAILLDRDHLLSNPSLAAHVGYALAKRFFTHHVQTVATPSIWGAGLAQWVAHFLEPKARVVYATPTPDGPEIARNLEDLLNGRRTLLVDNLIASGETMRRFVPLVERLGAEVVGIATVWDAAAEVVAGHEVVGLLNGLYTAHPAASCPLCAAGDSPTHVPY
jgi:orotate phosphoribosyltransferase